MRQPPRLEFELPWMRWAPRLLLTAFFSFTLGFVILGWLVQGSTGQTARVGEGNATARVVVVEEDRGTFEAATRFWGETLILWKTHPLNCWSGEYLHELQKRQCAERAALLSTSIPLALLPFLLALTAIGVTLWSFTSFHAASKRVIREGRLQGTWKLTSVERHRNPKRPELWAWLTGVEVYRVGLGHGRIGRLYLPIGHPAPRPDQVWALYSTGKFFGRIRYSGFRQPLLERKSG